MIDFGHCKFGFEKLDFSSLTLYRIERTLRWITRKSTLQTTLKQLYFSPLLSKEEKNIAKILCGPLFIAHLLELDR